MPPGGPKVNEEEIRKLRGWIDSTAPTSAAVTERDALSIFQMRCVVCHGKRLQQGGLDLRTQQARMKGGKSGPALIPGRPDDSLIIQRIVSGDMPPAKLQFDFSVRPPSTAEVDTLRRWIAAGAPGATAASDEVRDELVKDKDRQFLGVPGAEASHAAENGQPEPGAHTGRRVSAPEVKSQGSYLLGGSAAGHAGEEGLSCGDRDAAGTRRTGRVSER